MKIREKHHKKLIAFLIIINIVVIGCASFFVYRHITPKDSVDFIQRQENDVRVLVFIGDYVTAFGSEQATITQLEETYPDENFVSVNLANESSTSQQISDSLDEKIIDNLSQLDVDAIFVNIGATDANQGIATDVYAKNIDNILNKISGLSGKIILNCPPYIDSENKSADNLLLTYCQSLEKIELDNVHFGDASAYSMFKEPKNVLLSSDGIHPNDAGYQKLGETWANIYKAVSGN
jgi:Lysophospholipase L1 and related esterases